GKVASFNRTPRQASVVAHRVGILRLRGCFASRRTHSAQDDSAGGELNRRLSYRSNDPRLAVRAIHHGQYGEAEREQQQRSLVGGGIVGGLLAVEDINRDG